MFNMYVCAVNELCLDDAELAALGELALQCEKVYGLRREAVAERRPELVFPTPPKEKPSISRGLSKWAARDSNSGPAD